MASNTQTISAGDVVLEERNMRASRDNLLIDENQTLIVGQVCKKGTGNRRIALTANADEVQTITTSVGSNVNCVQTVTITGTSNAGTMKLGIRSPGDPHGAIRWTDDIAWDVTEATMTTSINAALDNLLGAGNPIVCAEIPNTDNPVLVLTFSGTGYTNRVHGLVGVDVADMTGAGTASVVMTTPGSGAVSLAGTYRLGITDVDANVQWTSALAADASLGTINAALDDALAASDVVATGTIISAPGALVLTYSGTDFTGKRFPLVEIDLSDLAGVDDVSIVTTTEGGSGATSGVNAVQAGAITSTALTAGNWTISVTDAEDDRLTTANLAHNASTGDIQTALDAILGANAVIASGTAITAMVFTWSGDGFESRPQDLVTINNVSLVGTNIVITQSHTTLGSPASVSGADSILLAAVTTAGSEFTTKGVFITRDAMVDRRRLEFGSGNANDAMAALAKLGIVVRDEPVEIKTLSA